MEKSSINRTLANMLRDLQVISEEVGAIRIRTEQLEFRAMALRHSIAILARDPAIGTKDIG